MRWLKTDPMFERHHFAQDFASGQWTMTELCSRYGISRNTGYKWRERFLALGVRGLEEQSRARATTACAAAGRARTGNTRAPHRCRRRRHTTCGPSISTVSFGCVMANTVIRSPSSITAVGTYSAAKAFPM